MQNIFKSFDKGPLTLRSGALQDESYLVDWLMEPGILRWFPMMNRLEVEDAAKVWISYARQEAVITAEWEGKPCGIANLYIQPYQRLRHQCLLAIIVGKGYRNKGIGTLLLQALQRLAKEKFNIKILHLEVYEGNPAMALYKRMGFVEFGCHPKFIKDGEEYLSKFFMQKYL